MAKGESGSEAVQFIFAIIALMTLLFGIVVHSLLYNVRFNSLIGAFAGVFAA